MFMPQDCARDSFSICAYACSHGVRLRLAWLTGVQVDASSSWKILAAIPTDPASGDHDGFHCWVERPKCCFGCHDAEDFLVGTFAGWGPGKSYVFAC